jgi:hypothetical protein
MTKRVLSFALAHAGLATDPEQCFSFTAVHVMANTSLHASKGQVLRLRGVVDRFGGFEQQGSVQHTVCVRNLELAASGQPLAPDHWWFRLRQQWCEAGVQEGDTIVFTAKVSHCTKGSHAAAQPDGTSLRPRERVLGFGGQVRDLVVQRRGRAPQLQLNALDEQLQREVLLRQEAEDAAKRLTIHRDALLREQERLRSQLATWKARCQILDPGLANQGQPRAPRGARHCRGFQHVDRLVALQRRRTVPAA